MSILYEALKKAEKQQGVQVPKLEVRDRQTFVDAMSRMENVQQKAIQSCVDIEAPRMLVRQRNTIISASIAGVVIIAAVLALLWLRANAQGPRVDSVQLMPTLSEGAATSEGQSLAGLREVNVQPVKRPIREVTISEAPVTKNVFEQTRDRFFGQVDFICTGIILDPVHGDYCILNDLVLRVGDSVNGAEIIAINSYTVDLRRDKKTITVPLARKGR